MESEITSPAEVELAVERLLDHMQNWLRTQPEALLIWSAPRGARKRAAALLADEVFRIPTREGQPVNRSMRRKITRELLREEREWWKGIKIG